jgi:hypothetical protein
MSHWEQGESEMLRYRSLEYFMQASVMLIITTQTWAAGPNGKGAKRPIAAQDAPNRLQARNSPGGSVGREARQKHPTITIIP